MLVGLFPELDAPGGVQRGGRHLAGVMAAFGRERGLECRFLSLNDERGLHRLSVAEQEFVFTGCDRSKLIFGAAALRAAWRGARLVVAGHPNLAPVAQSMRTVSRELRVIVCTHGVEVWQALPALRRAALRRADLVLAPSADTAEHLAQAQQIPRERIRKLPWGLDPQFASRMAQGQVGALPGGFPPGRVILSVGRWISSERYKGLDTLIAALPRLLTDWPDLQLVAVGAGDDRVWLENLAEEHGVRRHVRFLGGISQGELAACYAACEIFALPSRGEGFGLVYLEAMAHGKPVVAGAHGGAPEIVQDGVTGYLVPHGDVPHLATALHTLLADEALRREMGARGRSRVERDFRFEHFAKSFRKILREQCAS